MDFATWFAVRGAAYRRCMFISVRVTNVALVVASTLFAMTLIAGVLVVHGVMALILAGQLVGRATLAQR